jgi:hypothetical protein
VKLEQKVYKLVYDEILLMMAVVEGDLIDGPRLNERLTAWAGFGMYVSAYPIASQTYTYPDRSMNTSTDVPSRIQTTISLRLSSSR